MPVPKPKKGEKQDAYVSRTIEFLVGEGKDQEQAAAMAYQQWRDRRKVKKTQYEFIKSIPMDMSVNEIREAIRTAANGLLKEPNNGYADIIDIYLDGTCIVGLNEPGVESYFMYDYTFDDKGGATLSNPTEVERTWEEVEKDKMKRAAKVGDVAKSKLFKVDTTKRLIYGVVLAPDEFDAQGDIIDTDEIEKSAHSFMESYNKQLAAMGEMHKKEAQQVTVVENYIAPEGFKLGEGEVSKGSWVMVSKVRNDKIWDKVLKGEYTGYSIGGRGKRVPVDDAGNPIEAESKEE